MRSQTSYPHDPRFAFYFVHGMYDQLFAPYRHYRESDAYVNLVATGANGRTWWAVIRPSSNRTGTVLWSNSIPMGTVVRSAIPFSHAKRPRRTGSVETVGNPRQLSVIGDARRFTLPVPPPRFGMFRKTA